MKEKKMYKCQCLQSNHRKPNINILPCYAPTFKSNPIPTIDNYFKELIILIYLGTYLNCIA